MAAYDSVSQNLKFFNVAERSPIRRALVSLSVGTIRRYQDVGNTAARLRPVTHSQRMQSDFQRFSIYKLDAHSLADVFLVQSARGYPHWRFHLLDRCHVEFADVDEMAGNRRGGGHDRADQVSAAVFALAALEIAIAGAGAALVRRQDVRIHPDAHAAAGVAPFETGGGENLVEAFFFSLRFDSARARNDQRLLDVFRYVLACHKMRRGAQIIKARIGARANEYAIHRNVDDGRAGFQPHIFECALGGFLVVEVLEVVRIGDARRDARDHAGIRAPGDLRSDLLRLQLDLHVKVGAAIALEQFPALDSFLKRFPARYKGRPSRYANVVSSGAIIPARAPPSIVMLHTVIRPSIERERMASPPYSATWPLPPAMPVFPIMARIKSFAVTPLGRLPCTRMCIVLERDWTRHCVASTCSTSLVPIPKASVPNAPCVEVWLSPQTIVCPGCVMPSSGPMMCTMPWFLLFMSNRRTPDSRQFFSRASNCSLASLSRMGSVRSVVETEWSITAKVRSGRRTLRPSARSPAKAWGEVPSWIRWRSI